MKGYKQSKFISLLHPFTAKAIGLHEEDLYHSHSKSQELALRAIQQDTSRYKIRIDYFTEKWLPYSKKIHFLTKRFFPVTKPLGKGRSVWRRQYSLWHYCRRPDDLTIINMSGHGSKYIFKYAEKLSKKRLPYIAMIGGIHMSTSGNALAYYRQAHHILVHTELQQKELYKIEGFEDLDIRVLPLGADLSRFKPKKDKKLSGSLRLLFVGRVIPLKRVELAIEVLATGLKLGLEPHLDIVGFTPDSEYMTVLENKIDELGVRENIHFRGVIPQEALVPLYQNASLLLLPSKHESFGMVMVESMACGTPVAAIENSGGPEEVIQHGFSGILTSPEAYASTVVKLLKDVDKLRELQQNSVTWANEQFSIERTQKVLEKSITDAFCHQYG